MIPTTIEPVHGLVCATCPTDLLILVGIVVGAGITFMGVLFYTMYMERKYGRQSGD